ncbi:hypothetical protein BCIN_13g04170 [Botrytis cinerea B05.10]|uniref:Glycosyltransferase family 25 protein n=1 Tax=Botryotinia fuckeliana (strain B05.10) TaxID=332648 RepID=A0A384K169_BOTFB|nr:hypothetical protein BCIN_13g04170 [Botrytis cinerea B05.10]ATZ56580.1 hypothetical protein BCIN_13g04170 [Botrytis cinerea B05.10]
MIPRSSRPYLLGACVALVFIILFSLQTRQESPKSSTWLDYSDKSSMLSDSRNYVSATSDRNLIPADTISEIGRASNATLGFEKVVVIGLRERSDKWDAMVLSASLTGFEVEFADGIKGDEVVDKAKPPPGHFSNGGAMGPWRGHMNVIRSIIERKLASALIMEDDVDWDIRLRTQLPEFAKGIRTLSRMPHSQRQHSPYGDDWDILWPGHCGDELPSVFHKGEKDELYRIDNDGTVVPKSSQSGLKTLANYPANTRIVHKAGAPKCTLGYAVSYRGAQKILMALSVKGSNDLTGDNALASLCRDGYLDMKCFSVEPQLFQHHKPAVTKNKDGGINSVGQKEAQGAGEKEIKNMIVWSARLNLEHLIMGKKDYIIQG